MAKKHYDNKNDILKRMREVEKVQNRADKAVASSWTAFMLLGILTLYEDLGFREKRLSTFINGVHKRNREYEEGKLTLQEMKRKLYEDAGVVVEFPE